MIEEKIQISKEEPLLTKSRINVQNYQSINLGVVNQKLNDNKISTNKYTILTFLPINLFEQFSKIANIYFLMIAILQTIHIISITHGQPTILLPLVFVISLTACKDIFEDYSRYSSDKFENQRQCKVLTENENQQQKKWQFLKPGEIIKIHKNEYFPADCILLQTSNTQQNLAFVETKNLDGETSLQQKRISNYKYYGIENIQNRQQQDIIYVKQNIGQLNEFQGIIEQDQQQVILNQDNLLLRGSSLKNTEWVICVIVYTGKNTKIMLNSIRTQLKSGTIDKKTSIIVLLTFVFQLILSLIAAFIYSIDMDNYKYQKEENQFTFIQMFIMKMGNWTLILGNFIPISLLVTLEMVKFFQALIINRDTELKYTINQDNQESIQIGCKVQNSSVNEDLGQINYIFTDKTGTLTENIMKFDSLLIEDQILFSESDKQIQQLKDQDQKVELALKCLGLCHSIIFDEQKQPSSSSSEEIAIWEFLQQHQKEYIENQIIQNDGETYNYFVLNNKGAYEKWKVIQIFEFSSEKKRMSILVEKDKEVYLLTKGADDKIWELLNENQKSKKLEENIFNQAQKGLRVMVLSYKKIEADQFQKIQQDLKQIQSQPDQKKYLNQIQEELEQEMNLIGAIVLQDKLQEGIKESIQYLRKADIKIWMITGDKTQTALSIGRSSLLIENDIKVYTLEQNFEYLFKILKNNELKNEKYSVVIKGSFFIEMSLSYVYKFEQFIQFLLKADSVIFSRATPKLKAIIVNIVKGQKEQLVTLAIGDGANDVNMINIAHVGIGIKGLEGKQAARASDYQVARFKHIMPLIFYYGRENYRKNTTLVLYILYKNIFIVMINYWFGFMNTFSGQSLYESYTFQLFNVTVTFLPSFVFAIFDYTYSKQEFLNDYQKYKVCQDRIYFSIQRFLSFIVNAMIGSILILLTSLLVLDSGTFLQGYFYGFWNMGNMCFFGGVFITNLKLLAISNSISIIAIICYLISFISFFWFWSTLSIIKSNDLYNTYWEIMKSPEFYIFIIALLTLSQMERLIENYISKTIMSKYK